MTEDHGQTVLEVVVDRLWQRYKESTLEVTTANQKCSIRNIIGMNRLFPLERPQPPIYIGGVKTIQYRYGIVA